jgi:PTH1 family peptidyl-tRNA hydrolase
MSESNAQPALIAGLGNPGRQYARNRHNSGFMVVARLAKRHGLTLSRRKGRARVAEGIIEGRRVLLAQPQTHMNRSGRSVAALARYFKIPPHQTMIVYDDLDLPLAQLRLRPGGGSGGHKGLKSIIEQLHTQDFPRLRLGIDRPTHGDPVDYVLQNFTADEWIDVDRAIDRAVNALEHWLAHGIDSAMNAFNQPDLPEKP